MTDPRLIFPETSPAFLAEGGEVLRVPKRAGATPTDAFMARFEDRALYYDCFRSADGDSVFLVGPPPRNLDAVLAEAEFTDAKTGQVLAASHHVSRSTVLTVLEAAGGTEAVDLKFAGQKFALKVQPNLSAVLAGARILFSMNRDNELAWIHDWAEWHARLHNVDTLILFDNGSQKYPMEELASALTSVTSLKTVILFSWPYRFGTRDNAALIHHYWAHFLQISSMNMVLRRFGAHAAGLINCDVDELVAPIEGGDAFDLVRQSPYGVAAMAGTWVEPVGLDDGEVPRHRQFSQVLKGPAKYLCPKKWILDPSREWVQGLDVFPYWHRIMGAPDRHETEKPVARFWHFRGISTNWKGQRSQSARPSGLWHNQDPELVAAIRQVWPTGE